MRRTFYPLQAPGEGEDNLELDAAAQIKTKATKFTADLTVETEGIPGSSSGGPLSTRPKLSPGAALLRSKWKETLALSLGKDQRYTRLSPGTFLQGLKPDDFWKLCDGFEQLARRKARLGVSKSGEINSEEFLELVMPYMAGHEWAHLGHSRKDCQDMFNIVDKDGDALVRWEDFTNAMIVGTANLIDSEEKVRSYRMVQEDTLYTGLEQVIKSLKYIPKINKLLVNRKNRQLQLLDPDTLRVQTELPDVNPGRILDMEFIPTNNMIITSCADGFMRILANDTPGRDDYYLKQETRLEANLPVMKWNPSHKRLFCGTSRGYLWTYEGLEHTRPQPSLNLRLDKKYNLHTDSIMDLTFCMNSQAVATCSLDGTVALQDLKYGSEAASIAPFKFRGHEQGVYSIAHLDTYNVLLSAGFEFHANVWPYGSPDLPPIKLIDHLNPHVDSLLGVFALDPKPQVVTFDIKGFVKIWDIRKLQCVSVFTIPNALKKRELADNTLHSFGYIPNQKRFIVNGNHLTYTLESEEGDVDTTLAHETDALVGVVYSPKSHLFVSAVRGGEIKLWDSAKGQLENTLTGLKASEITCMCSGYKARCFVLGTYSGDILMVLFTGVVGATLSREGNRGVTSVSMCKQYLVSVHENGHVCIWDGDQISSRPPIAVISEPGRGFRQVAFCPVTQILGISDNHSFVRIYQLTAQVGISGKVREQAHNGPHKGEISALVFLSPYPALISTDSTGMLTLWTTKPHPQPGLRLVEWENAFFGTRSADPEKKIKPLGKNKEDKLGQLVNTLSGIPCVACFMWTYPNTLYTGDDAGYISKWDVTVTCTDCFFMGDLSSTKQSAAQRHNPHPPVRPPGHLVSWKAHFDGVASIQQLEAGYILSTGLDHRIHLWYTSNSGQIQCMGRLDTATQVAHTTSSIDPAPSMLRQSHLDGKKGSPGQTESSDSQRLQDPWNGLPPPAFIPWNFDLSRNKSKYKEYKEGRFAQGPPKSLFSRLTMEKSGNEKGPMGLLEAAKQAYGRAQSKESESVGLNDLTPKDDESHPIPSNPQMLAPDVPLPSLVVQRPSLTADDPKSPMSAVSKSNDIRPRFTYTVPKDVPQPKTSKEYNRFRQSKHPILKPGVPFPSTRSAIAKDIAKEPQKQLTDKTLQLLDDFHSPLVNDSEDLAYETQRRNYSWNPVPPRNLAMYVIDNLENSRKIFSSEWAGHSKSLKKETQHLSQSRASTYTAPSMEDTQSTAQWDSSSMDYGTIGTFSPRGYDPVLWDPDGVRRSSTDRPKTASSDVRNVGMGYNPQSTYSSLGTSGMGDTYGSMGNTYDYMGTTYDSRGSPTSVEGITFANTSYISRPGSARPQSALTTNRSYRPQSAAQSSPITMGPSTSVLPTTQPAAISRPKSAAPSIPSFALPTSASIPSVAQTNRIPRPMSAAQDSVSPFDSVSAYGDSVVFTDPLNMISPMSSTMGSTYMSAVSASTDVSVEDLMSRAKKDAKERRTATLLHHGARNDGHRNKRIVRGQLVRAKIKRP